MPSTPSNKVSVVVGALFGGRCEEKREEDGRVHQLRKFWNMFQNSDFFAVFSRRTGFKISDFSAVSRDF
jgi:hypothetical protein